MYRHNWVSAVHLTILKVKEKVKVYVYSPDIPANRFSGLYIIKNNSSAMGYKVMLTWHLKRHCFINRQVLERNESCHKLYMCNIIISAWLIMTTPIQFFSYEPQMYAKLANWKGQLKNILLNSKEFNFKPNILKSMTVKWATFCTYNLSISEVKLCLLYCHPSNWGQPVLTYETVWTSYNLFPNLRTHMLHA